MDKNSCSSDVLAWFAPHFGVDSRDWDLIKEYGMEFHPLWGYYKSDDPEIIEKQIRAMSRARIDVMAYAEFTSFGWSLSEIHKDRTLSLMTDMLKDKNINTNNIRLCLILHKYPPQVFERTELTKGIEHIYENLAFEDFYYNYRGKPLVLIYGDDQIEYFEDLKKRFKGLKLRQVFGTFFEQKGWKYCDDYPQKIYKEWVPVSPGADSSLEELYMRDMYQKYKDIDLNKCALFKRFISEDKLATEKIKKNPIIKYEWEDGGFYRKQLERAVKADPEIIFIASWNDWQFKNQIEPSREYGFKYIDLTARILGR